MWIDAKWHRREEEEAQPTGTVRSGEFDASEQDSATRREQKRTHTNKNACFVPGQTQNSRRKNGREPQETEYRNKAQTNRSEIIIKQTGTPYVSRTSARRYVQKWWCVCLVQDIMEVEEWSV